MNPDGSAVCLSDRTSAWLISFAVKVAQSSGLIEGCEVAKVAQLAGIDLYGGTMLEGPVGTIASAHTFSTFESLAYGTELFGPCY